MKNKNNAFCETVSSGKLLFLDGAMGTRLQAAGMPPGIAPEKFCLAKPEILINIHKSYVEAGSDIITSCTFGANSFKLPKDMNVFETNKQLVRIAREAAENSERKIFVAGNVGPSGHFAKPLGKIAPEEMINSFAEQIRGLAAGGADLIFMETQFDIAEARAAVVAARKVCDLPIMVSMTFEHGVSLTGSTPAIFAETMLNMGVDVIGTNCSLGPDEMLPVVMELLAHSPGAVMAEPNAGLPELVGGKTVFHMGPEVFAEKTAGFASRGCAILGGCCGTTPDHIRMLRKLALNAGRLPRSLPKEEGIYLTSRSILAHVGPDRPLAVIGERINPTGKPKLALELQNGEFSHALQLADEQIEAGATALDVNVGAPMVDEVNALRELACLLVARTQIPLSLDSSSSDAIAAALPYYPASCLVNSIDGEKDRMRSLGPLCRDYGSPFVLLPISGATLPVTARERIAIVEKLLEEAYALGIPKRLIMIDALALAVSSSMEAGRECLEMIKWCRNMGFATTIGLSNISFGLPARILLNSVFLGLAHGAGLSSSIANPSAPRLMETVDAINVLMGQDKDADKFIGSYAKWQSGGAGISQINSDQKKIHNLYDIVLAGDRENVTAMLEKELASGNEPFDIVNKILIPAITKVGELYESREYFLPQLIRSAETMRAAFEKLKPLLEEKNGAVKRPVVVMATVEGDIHDIGKNIVSLLLGNHGFEVVDAGKDVCAKDIVACAEKNNASIIGLSALMTTTMIRMEDTIRLVRERNLPIRVLVGGAAVTGSFAESIGADAYCEDAVATVRAAQKFIDTDSGNTGK